MNQQSKQSKGKMLLSLLAKVGKNQKENPQTISSQHYTNQIHIKQQKQKESDQNIFLNQPKNNKQNAKLQQQMNQNQSLMKIYIQLFGEEEYNRSIEDLNREKFTKRNLQIQIQEILVQSILQEIYRLQQIKEDYTKYHKLLQKSAKGGTNEQKWKIIVLTDRQKIQKLKYQLQQQKRLKDLVQKQLNSRIQQIQRLSNMNNIKFQKINDVIEELDTKTFQLEEKNNTIIEMQMNLSTINIKNEEIQSSLIIVEKQKQKLKQQLLQVTHSLNQITQTLMAQRQKSFLQPQKQEGKGELTNVLLQEDEQINRQIYDIKQKYQIQIEQLQTKICQYQGKMQQLTIQLSQKSKNNNIDSSTQTEQNVVKATYYNSLQDDLQGQYSPQVENNFNQFDDQLGDLQLSIDPKSSHNHVINTPRDIDAYSEKDEHNYINDAQFEDGNSLMSNTPSKYMETVQQLTAQLAQAYQKINQLTNRIQCLEQENKKLKAKNMMQQRKPINDGKSLGGYFTSFFKK